MSSNSETQIEVRGESERWRQRQTERGEREGREIRATTPLLEALVFVAAVAIAVVVTAVVRGITVVTRCGRPLSVLSRPIARRAVVLVLVAHVLQRDGADQGVLGVAVGQEGTDGQENFGNCQCGRPVVLKDIQTDDALTVDVAVVNARLEDNLRWLEGVFRGEGNVQGKDATFVGRPVGAQNC